ncbi:MAG: tryptophan synthase subunit alpha [Rhodoferax sp.]|nr:tryptophan synthase subunit alpha [Rhodoferax sp.]
MSRIGTTFARLGAHGGKALIPFVTAGFPYPDVTPELMHALVAGGADVIELGVPFSDPSADGAVIQKAGDRALAAGIGMTQVLAMVQAFRLQDHTTPVVLMGYANPLERYDQIHASPAESAAVRVLTAQANSLSPQSSVLGRQSSSPFVRDAAAAGVDGVLVVDYPPEECEDFAAELKRHGLDLIFLLAPTSTEARMAQVGRLASGYVYYVSLKGVTGAGTLDTAAVAQMLPRIRAHVHCPVGVGFGIRDGTTARAIGAVADAVVIGSRLIQLIEALPRDQVAATAQAFMRQIRTALDS